MPDAQLLIWKKTVEKVFNWSEVHLSEVTSYKVHILVVKVLPLMPNLKLKS